MRNGNYILVIAPSDYPGIKYRDRYVYEHHLVWWQNTQETIDTTTEVIHHKNHDTIDNRFENLEKQLRKKHTALHRTKPVKIVYLHCHWCGSVFEKKRSVYLNSLLYKDFFFCSRSCGAKNQRHNEQKRT